MWQDHQDHLSPSPPLLPATATWPLAYSSAQWGWMVVGMGALWWCGWGAYYTHQNTHIHISPSGVSKQDHCPILKLTIPQMEKRTSPEAIPPDVCEAGLHLCILVKGS